MKAVYSWMFFGVMAIGLISGPPSLRAQPANDSTATADERALGDDEPVPSEDTPAPSEDTPAPSEAAPAPSEAAPAPSGGQPASHGNAPVTNAATISISASNNPWSQGVSMEDREAARSLFLEGNRLFRIPLFAKAAEKYVAALRKWKHPSIYLNLAVAQLNAGQEVEARASLERALQHGEEPLGAENYRGAQLQLEEVTRHLGRIRVSCRTPGAQVSLDGEPLFVGPGSYEGWVKAKDHELTAKKPEYLSEARRVTIVPGQFVDINLKLLTLSEATDVSRRWAAWKPRAVTAVGGAIVAAGGVLHALAFRNFRAYDDEVAGLECGNPIVDRSSGCPKGDPDLLRLDGLLRRAKRQQQIAVGSYIVGIPLIAAGVVLLYMNRPRLEELEAARSSARGVSITPAMSSDMLGMMVSIKY